MCKCDLYTLQEVEKYFQEEEFISIIDQDLSDFGIEWLEREGQEGYHFLDLCDNED